MIRARVATRLQQWAATEESIALGVIENGLDPKHWRTATNRRDRFARLAKLLGAK